MSDLTGIYEKIMMDEEWYEWMDKIKKLSASEAHGENKALLADHGMRHAMRVAEYAVDFIDECHQYFGPKVKKFHSFGHESDVYLTAIAALLHDIGIVEGKKGHAERSKEMAGEYLKKFSLEEDEILIILGAIGCHGGEESPVNLVDAALMMGDKMDITRSRILAFYDESLTPLLAPIHKEFLKVKRVNYFLESTYGHGVLEWGIVKNPETKDFNQDVVSMIDLIMKEWPKCVTIPSQVTENFLKLGFSFIADEVA